MASLWTVRQLAGKGTTNEENGVIISETDHYSVKGPSANRREALGALGLPQPHDFTVTGLEVKSRKIEHTSAVDGEHIYMVEVVKEQPENREKPEDTEPQTIFRVGTSLNQVTTQVDKDGNDVDLEFDGDPQVGEVSVMVPQSTLVGDISVNTNAPGAVSQSWAGYVNDATWLNGAAGTWLCTVCEADPQDLTEEPLQLWRFHFEFQYNSDGWDPQAYYIDSSTGRPPQGLVDGTGKKTVSWYTGRDFSELFNL